jgi:3-oxoacyl-(acyl-carrier-protein) synthase
MENNRIVYAVSDNIISSLGCTTEENIQQILSEKTGVKPVADTSIYVEPFAASLILPLIPPKGEDNSSLFRSVAGSCEATRLEQLMLISSQDAIKGSNIDVSSPRTIFIFSTTKGNIDLISNKAPSNSTKGGEQPDECLQSPSQREFKGLTKEAELHEMAKRVSSFYNSPNDPIVVSNACISGVLAVILGERLLKSGKYDNAVLIGGDLCSEFAISGFMSFKSVSQNPCKPYDKDRDGLSMGEGVATLILSVDKKKVKDKTPVMIAGGSSSNDANHISGPSRTGDGLCFALTDALKEAGLSPEEIDLVNTHGTATPFNDEMESKALGLASLNERPLLGLKGYFGHTLGAAGLIESVVCIEAIRRQIQFRTIGFSELGTPIPLNVTTETKPAKIKNIIKTASGFGGCNAAVVFSTTNSGVGNIQHIQGRVVKECTIEKQKVYINDKIVFDGTDCENFAEFIRMAFKSISEPYMKFSKMDDLCKLGLTATEFLLQGEKLPEKYEKRDIAVILANRFSSLDTDIEYQKLINDRNNYLPSPAVFVYTLANIVIGEICIRQKFQGENMFLISEKPDMQMLQEEASRLFVMDKAKACVVGWADFMQGEYKANIILMEHLP